MGTIDVRNLDDDVIARLKERTRDNDRSLEAEVRALLTEVSGRPSKKKFIELANPISAMPPQRRRTNRQHPAYTRRQRQMTAVVDTSVDIKWFASENLRIEALDLRVVTADQCLHTVVQYTAFAPLVQPLAR